MTWQQVMMMQIIASTAMTLWYRKISVTYPKNTFTTFLFVYIGVATAGVVLSVVGQGGIAPLPRGVVLWYILGEGLLIPLSWLLAYKLLSIIGASAMAIAQSITFLTTALFGVLFLHEPLTLGLFFGALFLLSAVYIALSVKSTKTIKSKVSFGYKLFLLAAGSVALATGLVFEKLAITSVGVWSYAMYGWFGQFLGAACIVWLFGRHAFFQQLPRRYIGHATLAACVTPVTGGLFILALSKGTLSAIIISSTAKIALTSVLAFWLLKERNNLPKRIIAFTLAVCGLGIVFL